MWLVALRKLYDAEVAESTAVIDTFLKNSVGVADHDNFMKTVKIEQILRKQRILDLLTNQSSTNQ